MFGTNGTGFRQLSAVPTFGTLKLTKRSSQIGSTICIRETRDTISNTVEQ